MRHYSTLSEAEINSLALVFPTTTNMTLCLQYGISRAFAWLEKGSCNNGDDEGAR